MPDTQPETGRCNHAEATLKRLLSEAGMRQVGTVGAAEPARARV